MRVLRFAIALSVAAVAIASVSVKPSHAGDQPGKRYRDGNAKFSFRIFDDWDPVPLETEGKGFRFGGDTDKFLVVKYMQTGAEKRGLESSQMQAFRMGKGTAGLGGSGETTQSDGSTDPFEKKLRELAKKDDPTTMKELFEKLLESYGFGGFLDLKQAKAIKSKDDVPGSMWVVERKNERMPSSYPPYLLVFASWKKGDMELGMWMYAPGETRKKFEQGFQSVVKSFMFFDPKAEDVKTIDALKDLPIPARKKRQIERGLVKGWAVAVSPKKNYVIIYNTKGNRNTLLAKIIGERIEAIREQIYETRFPPAAKIEAISIVRICGDASEYRAYGGPYGSAGYWSSDTEELVFYDASPAKAPDDDTLAVLYHEAFHQFIYYSVGKVAPHSWFNEGTGDYFAGAKYSGGKFTIRPFNWRIATIQAAIRKGPCPYQEKTEDEETRLKFDRASEGYSPLKALVKMTQGDYYSYPSISYAQGWSFIYFLRDAVPKNPKWNEKWGQILETYFRVLKEEVNKKRPLAPVKPPPDEPGMGEPGMDEPGMGEPGSDDPGMDDPGMSDPGMDDPGMSDPGMDDPGMGDPGMGDPSDPGAIAIPPSFSRFGDDSAALRKAVEEAFKDVDFDELEKAWKESTLKVK
jgi:hypothetical protein